MLYEIHLPEIKVIKKEGNAAIFAIEPLYPGYGMTLGNSLRRVILSSLPGAAVTAVKIDGVSHEFSTIKDVKEDAVEIVLNLKRLCVKSYSDEEETIVLDASGAGVVTAKQFTKNPNVEITNQNHVIATLDNKNSKLHMEVKVEKGRGYVPVEKRDSGKLGIDMIAVDALYSPIKRVRYNVESTRVGQMTNLDRLVFEVETNGIISPEEAITQASEILVDHFLVLSGKDTVCRKVEAKETSKEEVGDDILIEEVNLSPRTTNALLNNDIKSISDILALNDNDLKTLKGFGSKAFDEVKEKIIELGLDKKEGQAVEEE
ncbi:MAG: DNA-directed RNA polymerase subunit alpha [Patescibacteria group bacterium]|jgi:DNA-directed RNA polymerase subunit alpha|nr:DNA-directed RNA polymerase subunit alpha [Patescibacteria group bacterium]